MAQPSYAISYIGAMYAEADTPYTGAAILVAFPGATAMIMKTSNIKVSVNNTEYFDLEYMEEGYLETGHTYRFNKPCTIAIGVYKAVV